MYIHIGKLLTDKCFWYQCTVLTAPPVDAPSETRSKLRVTFKYPFAAILHT